MNQILPLSSFQPCQEASFWQCLPQIPSFSKQLQALAARFKMHYAIIHRLGPSGMALKDATYITNLRNLEASDATVEDLVGEALLNKLYAGNAVGLWKRENVGSAAKNDPLSRLNIRSGVSVSFHNALGNHVALSLFDSQIIDFLDARFDCSELSRLAIPLIDSVLMLERSKNQKTTSLTAREISCLQWAAAGKTSLEAGIILDLSLHTVNQYLASATTKLGAVNRTHAVTKAVRLGLINLSGI